VTSTNRETPANAIGSSAREPHGAVLVCGADVAGIHASLDLSAAGFRVYLVEEGPGIHGGMEQVDKSDAAGDGIACIMYPKLVECARNPNIDVLSMSDVITVEGEPGNLKATIRQRPPLTDCDTRSARDDQQEKVFDLEIGAVLLTKRGQVPFTPSTDDRQSGGQQAETTPDPFLVVQESKGVADTVVQASAAAARVMTLLAAARGSLERKRTYPPERDVTDEPPRVGVFVCHCGTDIASVVDVEHVVEQARQLSYVALAETNVSACACEGQDRIVQAVAEHRLNRVVVAGCSPQSHELMFRDTLRCAGLNPHLLEMANIRDQCARVHADRPKQATEKAIDLTRMAVGRAAHLVPLTNQTVPVKKLALVIGGGIAGMTAALALADQGFPVRLAEKTDRLGGPTPQIGSTLDGETVLAETIKRVESHLRIRVYLEAVVTRMDGRIGHFTTTITRTKKGTGPICRDGPEGASHKLDLSPFSSSGSQMTEVKHGVVVVATGTAGQESESTSRAQDETVQGQRADREELARLLRVPLNADGFFVQAHPGLRPVDSAREGVFLCDVPDAEMSIVQASAVAARAASVLSRKEIQAGGMTASVDPSKCISCMTCVHVCPFKAPQVGEHNKSEIQSGICMGCGTCSAECPAKAITLQNCVDDQILGAIDSLLAPDVQDKELVLNYPEQVGIATPRWTKRGQDPFSSPQGTGQEQPR